MADDTNKNNWFTKAVIQKIKINNVVVKVDSKDDWVKAIEKFKLRNRIV